MASTSLNARPRRTRDGRLGSTGATARIDQPARVDNPARRRIAWNFVRLSAAELICRSTSLVGDVVAGPSVGEERVRTDGIRVQSRPLDGARLAGQQRRDRRRELSRHPRLIRPLVDQVLAYKTLLALVLFSLLALVGSWTLTDRADWLILVLYGSMLFTTAIGLDFVFRGTERMGLVAISLCVRTGIYAVGVLVCVHDASRIVWVPIWLTVGEMSGITLVWYKYLRQYRLPRPRLGLRFLFIMVRRGRTVCLMQLSQAVINTADLLGGRVLEFLGRGRRLWGSAPDGHGVVDVWPDPATGRLPDSFAVVAADRVRRTRGTRFARGGPGDRLGAAGRGLHRAGGPLGPSGAAGGLRGGRASCWRWASGEPPC